MAFYPYSTRPLRLLTQVIADLGALAALWFLYRTAHWVHDTMLHLAEPAKRLEGGGQGVAQSLRDAGHKMENVPLVGDRLRSPFDSASNAADNIAQAGHQQVALIENLAATLGITVFVVPALAVLLLWLPPRIRFALRAGDIRRATHHHQSLDLLALRALNRQPLRKLNGLGPNLVERLQTGDPDTLHALAALEIKANGITPPKNMRAALAAHRPGLLRGR